MMTYKQWCAVTSRTDAEKHRYKVKLWKQNVLGTSMVLLPFLGFLCFTLFPMLFSFAISFSKLSSTLISEAEFTAGFSNYQYVLEDLYTWKALRTTVVYSLSVGINLLLAVFLTNTVNKSCVYGKKFWMVLFFLPQVFSGLSISMMWRWLLNDYGLINTVLMNVFGRTEPIHFFTDADYFMPALYMISAWQHGTNIIVLLSAFAGVNKSLQEAARLDGADEFHVFWKITFPQLTPTIYYLLTMNLIVALQEQALFQYLLTTDGGPDLWGLSLTYQMWRRVNINLSYGTSCALSWVIAIFIMLVMKINTWISKLWVSYD